MKKKSKMRRKMQRKGKIKKKWLVFGAVFLFILFIFFISMVPKQKMQSPPQANQKSSQPPTRNRYVQGQVLVKFKKGYSEKVIMEHLALLHASIKSHIEGINVTVVSVPPGQEEVIRKQLSQDTIVDYAEPDYITEIQYTPNDPDFGNQWGLLNTGQDIGGRTGTAGDDIHIQQAWDFTKGAGINVAVIDTGIDLNHSDVASKVVAQKDFTNSSIDDKCGHGTHVAGLVAAVTDNGQGIAGVCPECGLIIAKAMSDDGHGSDSIGSSAIVWAADSGAKVINMSFGGPDNSKVQADAVEYAWNKGVVIVAAAGNSNENSHFYPTALPNVVSVGATDNNDKKASFSNYGDWVKVTAPGDKIYSTLPTHPYFLQDLKQTAINYDYFSGTSMAAPITSGVVALIWSSQYGTSRDAVVSRLYATVDKIPGTGLYWTEGRVNAGKAVAPPPTPTPTATPKMLPTKPPISPIFHCMRLGPGGCED